MSILLAFPMLAAAFLLDAKAPYLISICLFYAVPGIYVTVRFGYAWQVVRNLVFAVVTSIPFTIVVDLIGTASHVWYVPQTAFPIRFLGIIPGEDFLWMGVATYTIVTLYAVASDTGNHKIAGRRMLYFIALIGPPNSDTE